MTARLYRCWAPLDLAEVREVDGDVLAELDILELAPQVHGGRKFNFTAADADAMVANHAADAARGYQPPIVLGHEATDAQPAVGWITGLQRVGTRLRASVRLLKEFAARVKAGEWRFVSPEVASDYADQVGKNVGAKVRRLAATHTPHQKGHADGGMAPAFALAEIAPSTEQESDMDASKVQEFETALAETKQSVAAFNDKVTALTTKLDEATKALGEKDATIKTLTEQVGGLSRGVQAKAITDVVTLAEQSGKLTPAQRDKWLPGLASDPIAAFEKSPWKSVAAFAEYVAQAPSVPGFNSRISASTGQPADAADSDLKALSEKTGVSVESLKKAATMFAEQAS